MKNITVNYENATILHSNKYNRNLGIIVFNFFLSNFYQDILFKLDNDNREFLRTFKNINLPIYPGQKIKLVTINGNVIAFIDINTNVFYYLSNNLQNDLNYGLKINWPLIIVVTFVLFFVSSLRKEYDNLPIYVLLFPICSWIYQRISNFILERKIDKLILSK